MRTVRVAQSFSATVAEAERCWYDTDAWPRWVDGASRVLSVDAGWPAAGATVTWESGPAGRGRVTERVVAHDPLRGQTVEVQDVSIRGRQTVTFTPAPVGVEVGLELDYEILRRNPTTWLVDLAFIRRAMRASLQSTVSRFGAELESARQHQR